MDTLRQDLRFAVRSLLKNRGFTAAAIIALALGIGATTAVFSVVNAVLLRPLPYGDPQRVAMVWNTWEGWPETWLSEPEYWDIKRQNRTLAAIGVWGTGGQNLTGGDFPERVRAAFVTHDVFDVLDVAPLFGRTIAPDEDAPGAPRVAVISEGLWRRRFAADPGLVGRTILLNDSTVTVIGVMPASFQLPLDYTGERQDLWLPLALDPADPRNRGSHYLYGVARLRPGVSLDQASADLDAIVARWKDEFSNYSPAFGTFLRPVQTQIFGDVRPALYVLVGAVGFVLLITCANVANLLLARAEARHREIAVRSALGARRGRIVRQLLTESVLLALVGGGLGLLLAVWGVDLLRTIAPPSVPRVADATIDARVLAFTFTVAVGTGLLFGLVPAAHAARSELQTSLKDGGRGSTADAGRQRLRRALVVCEMALALVLVIGAGLLIQSFSRLRNVDAGFRTAGVLTLQLNPPPSRYPGKTEVRRLLRDVIVRAEALPGVRAAGGVRALPMQGAIGDWSFQIDGAAPSPTGQPQFYSGDWQVVSPGYFETLSIPLKQGRLLTDADDERGTPVILLNEELARRAFPAGDAIGQRVRLGGGADTVWRTVVGIVADVRTQGLDAEIRPELFLPAYQFPAASPGAQPRNFYLVVRTERDPVALASAVRREVRAIDPAMPVSSVRTLDEVVGAWAAERRLSMIVLSAFAMVAVVLAAVGIYGVMAYAVAQRTHEIGIRMALGARARDVVALLLRQGAMLALVGITIGLFVAFGLTRLMRTMLFEISATDPLTFAAIALLLGGVALLAVYIPARRATRVEPFLALRAE